MAQSLAWQFIRIINYIAFARKVRQITNNNSNYKRERVHGWWRGVEVSITGAPVCMYVNT